MSTGNDKEAAKMLVFASDKTKYNVGETAIIKFPSGTEGRALVSIENGSDVIEHKWVKTSKGETKVESSYHFRNGAKCICQYLIITTSCHYK